jgi:4-hydroxybenzoate polyprenyltransferase
MGRTFRNILILSRVANLPTVWSNVFVGWTLGLCLTVLDVHNVRQLLGLIFNFHLLSLLAGTSCIYAAGMILNDLFDLGWDRENRPERPLVTGQLSLSAARITSVCLLLAGAALIILGSATQARTYVGLQVLALVVLIFIYNRWHKGVAWAPYVMGLCRFMLPLIGFVATGAAPAVSSFALEILFNHAASLWLLTLLITVLAKHETRPSGLTSGRDFLILLVPVPLLGALPWNGMIWVSALGFWLWVLISNRRHPLPLGVGGRVADRLAAFPFVDAMAVGLTYGILLPTVAAVLHAFVLGCFVLVLIGRRFVPVT